MTDARTPHVRRGIAFAAATGVVLWTAAGLAMTGARPTTVAIAVAVAFLPYAALLAYPPPLPRRRALLGAAGAAAVAGLALVAAPSVLSDDVYRYLWDGRVLLSGLDPYEYAPDDPALAHLRDGLWERVNHRHIPTIYPPLAQALFGLAGAVAHAAWPIKLLALLAHLGVIPVVARLAGARGTQAAWAWALNPLAISEAALGGHVDVVAALAIAACVLALASNRPVRAALLAGAASGLKLIGLAIAPLIARRSRAAAALGIALALVPVIPLLGAGRGSDAAPGVGQYASRWQGNAGAFVVVRAGIERGLEEIGPMTSPWPGHVELDFLRPALKEARGTPFDPRAAVTEEKKAVSDPADFEIGFLADLLARALVLAFVLGLAAVLVRRRTEPVVAARWVVLTALLLAPQVHPWYLLWLLPLEVATGRVAGLLWSALALVAYGPLDGWLAYRVWHEMPVARAVEHGVVLAVVGAEALGWLGRRRPHGEPAPAPEGPGDPRIRTPLG